MDLLIPLIVVGALLQLVVSAYNGLVNGRNRVDEALGQIQVQLKRRYDLIPNLVETVKGYAAHERGTLEEVIKARNAAMAAQGPAQQAAAHPLCTPLARLYSPRAASSHNLYRHSGKRRVIIVISYVWFSNWS